MKAITGLTHIRFLSSFWLKKNLIHKNSNSAHKNMEQSKSNGHAVQRDH